MGHAQERPPLCAECQRQWGKATAKKRREVEALANYRNERGVVPAGHCVVCLAKEAS